jgi:hypothetical protein
MIEGGDKPEFAMAVCQDMILLYQAKIDELLPEEIKEKGDVSGITAAVAVLEDRMTAKGGDYKIIDHYFDRQMASSEGLASQAMQDYLLTQRRDADDMEENYSFAGHTPDPEAKARYKSSSLEEKGAQKYDLYRGGERKIYMRDELEAKLEKICQKYCGGDREKYAKTVSMYKAFTAIALDKMDFPGKNPDHTFTAYRGIKREVLQVAYPDYEAKAATGYVAIKHCMGESTSIGSPVSFFNGPGTDTHTFFNVPFARVVAAYCLHLFADGMYKSPRGPNEFWGQREFVCNLNGLEAKVTRN